jgi:sugar/nucleoside kinase (ribokinase family)
MSRRADLSVVVLGSLKLDVVARLERQTALDSDSVYEVVPMTYRLGGTAGTFCAAASPVFKSVSAISALGNDPLSDTLIAYLDALNVDYAIERCDVPNGVVLSLRKGSHSDGQRILLASEASPHRHVSAAHVGAHRDLITRADALVSDTYFLASPESAKALQYALEIAKDNGVTTVLDLVPHSLSAIRTWADLKPFVALASVVVVEARTIVGLMERRWPVVDLSDDQVVRRAVTYVGCDSPATWLVRHGAANLGRVVRLSKGAQICYSTLIDDRHDQWGFGDRLLASELDSLLRK